MCGGNKGRNAHGGTASGREVAGRIKQELSTILLRTALYPPLTVKKAHRSQRHAMNADASSDYLADAQYQTLISILETLGTSYTIAYRFVSEIAKRVSHFDRTPRDRGEDVACPERGKFLVFD